MLKLINILLLLFIITSWNPVINKFEAIDNDLKQKIDVHIYKRDSILNLVSNLSNKKLFYQTHQLTNEAEKEIIEFSSDLKEFITLKNKKLNLLDYVKQIKFSIGQNENGRAYKL